VRGGIEDPGRPEKITIKLPPGVRMENAPDGANDLPECWNGARYDAFIAPRAPSIAGRNNPDIGWLFPDPIVAGQEYFKRTGIFRSCTLPASVASWWRKHPWLPAAVSRRSRNRRRVPGGARGYRGERK